MSQSSSIPLARPVIAFMTDFGLDTGDVGILKGVVLSIVPEAQLVDVTHLIAPQNIPSGAWILRTSYRYFPHGTIFVCVIDPGVGSNRRPIALHAGEWYFVGPDNGLFSHVLAEQPVHQAVLLSQAAYHISSVSTTFHGRDIFAPVAAHLAHGVTMLELGPSIDTATLRHLDMRQAKRLGIQVLDAYVLHVDHFGNLVTNIPLHLVPDLFSSSHVELTFPEQGVVISERRRFFSDNTQSEKKRPFIYGDSSGYVGVALRNGNAAHTLLIKSGTAITFLIEP